MPNDPVTLDHYINLLFEDSIRISSDEIEFSLGLQNARDSLWELAERRGFAIVKELEDTLNLPEVVKRFAGLRCNLRKHCLEQIKYLPACIPGYQSIDYLIEHCAIATLDKHFSGCLSQYQDDDSILYLFEKLSSRSKYVPFLEKVYGECIYRHPAIISETALSIFFDRYIRHYWHGSLPRQTTFLEQNLTLVNYGKNGGRCLNTPNFHETEGATFEIHTHSTEQQYLREREVAEDIDSAFQRWLEQSNGELLTKSYSLGNADSSHILELIKGLSSHVPDCFERDAGITSLKAVTPSTAFSYLFNAALGGGCAYCGWGYSLKARLQTWKTFCGLMGIDWHRGFESVQQDISQTEWFILTPTTEWFYQVLNDIWIICVNRKHQYLTMLAATDTD